MTLNVDVSIEWEAWDAVSGLDTLVERAIEQARQHVGMRLAQGAEVSVLLCDDAEIRELNSRWRGIDKATNVLSFPAGVPGPLHQKPLLGDIAVAYETTRREAEDEGKTVPDHFSHLIVHGFLHLVGYDHETEAEAEAMETLETRILTDLGIADPYAGSEPAERDAR